MKSKYLKLFKNKQNWDYFIKKTLRVWLKTSQKKY